MTGNGKGRGQRETVAFEARSLSYTCLPFIQCKLSQKFFNKPALLSRSCLFAAAKFVCRWKRTF